MMMVVVVVVIITSYLQGEKPILIVGTAEV